MRSRVHFVSPLATRLILCSAVAPLLLYMLGAGALATDITVDTPTTGPVGTPGDDVITVTQNGAVTTTNDQPAVKLQGSDVLVNNGVISSTNASAVKRSNKDNSGYRITNRGRIESATNPAINLRGGGSEAGDVLINSGTIIGGNGEAIRMGGGDDMVQLETGSNVVGNIHGYSGVPGATPIRCHFHSGSQHAAELGCNSWSTISHAEERQEITLLISH